MLELTQARDMASCERCAGRTSRTTAAEYYHWPRGVGLVTRWDRSQASWEGGPGEGSLPWGLLQELVGVRRGY